MADLPMLTFARARVSRRMATATALGRALLVIAGVPGGQRGSPAASLEATRAEAVRPKVVCPGR